MNYNKRLKAYCANHEIDFIKNDTFFNDDEIYLLQEYLGFKDFNGKNINLHKYNGNNLAMELIIQMDDMSIMLNPLSKALSKDSILESYSYLLAKVILNKSFDINAKNDNGSTLLSNIIRMKQIDAFYFLLKTREDLESTYFKTNYGNTYKDLAIGESCYEMASLL